MAPSSRMTVAVVVAARECAIPAALINLTLAQFNQAVQIAWKVGLLHTALHWLVLSFGTIKKSKCFFVCRLGSCSYTSRIMPERCQVMERPLEMITGKRAYRKVSEREPKDQKLMNCVLLGRNSPTIMSSLLSSFFVDEGCATYNLIVNILICYLARLLYSLGIRQDDDSI